MTRFRLICLLAVSAFVLAACPSDTDDGNGASPTSAPTPAPSTSAEFEVAAEELLDCLEDGGIDLTVAEEPRFGAGTEIQVAFQTSDGLDNVGVYVYESPDEATEGKDELDSTLESFSSPPSSQVGNVLVAGLHLVLTDEAAAQAVPVFLDCLGGFSPPPA